MALVSDLKVYGGVIEWGAELPFDNRPRESPPFVLRGTECHLLFSRKYDSSYRDYIYRLELLKKIPHLFQVTSYAFRNHSFLSSFCVSSNSIWHMLENQLKSRLELNLSSGNFFKFLIIFHEVDTVMIPKTTGDIGVQTPPYLSTTDACLESLSQDLGKLLDGQDGPDTDLEFKCREEIIPAHSLLLRSRSKVLAAMLQSDMVEGRTGRVDIQDMEADVFQEFVQYLYTGSLAELTVDKAKALYDAGDKYAIRSLVQRCGNFLMESTTPENACEFLALADAHSDQCLKDKVISYILENKIHLNDDIWLAFCEKHPVVANQVLNRGFKLLLDS